jgi:hypothetical protein
MVEAFNTFGSSANSTAFSVYAAISPSGLAAPTTLQSVNTIIVDWNQPSDNGGLSITGYTVQVLDNTFNWVSVI